ADVNAKENLRGTTALMWAAGQRHPEAVKMLLEIGADHAATSGMAGLPRNYMAPRVNTAAVKDAQRRYAAAIAAGRTYEQQLEYEVAQGAKINIGFRQRQLGQTPPAGAAPPAAGTPPTAGTPPAAAPSTPAPQTPPAADTAAAAEAADDTDVIVAGLVGSGGGGLTALVFAAREGDLESAKNLLDAGADVN